MQNFLPVFVFLSIGLLQKIVGGHQIFPKNYSIGFTESALKFLGQISKSGALLVSRKILIWFRKTKTVQYFLVYFV